MADCLDIDDVLNDYQSWKKWAVKQMITPFYFIIRECGKILRREVKILQKKIEEYVNAYYLTFYLSDHLLKYEWNFTGGGGHSLLWLEATTFLN